MVKILSKAYGIGAATLLASQSAHSDETFLQPGVSLGQFPASAIPTLQNTVANQSVSDITPDPSLLPSNTLRWLLVKTKNGLSLTLPENYTGDIMHFGQNEKFFVRFGLTTGLPEVSTDCVHWQPYSAGSPLDISREEQTTILSISADLQILNTLQTQQQTLATTLAQKEDALLQAEDILSQVQTQYEENVTNLAITDSNRINRETQKNGLESNITPEAQLRTDVQPTVQNTTLSDTTKNTNTQLALATYDAAVGSLQGMSAATSVRSTVFATQDSLAFIQYVPSPAPAPQNMVAIPTSSEVQTTINLLTQELSRLQTQINDVSTQITAKQNEITATQNSINTTKQSLDQLTAQLMQYANDYAYWRDEYNRLGGLRDTASNDMSSIKTTYGNNRSRLMNEGGRNDVPSDIEVSNIMSQIGALKSRINTEASNITVATNTWGTDTTTKNLADSVGPTVTRLSSSYYYYSDFYSSTRSYPATVKMYLKATGSSSYTLSSTTYTAYNTNHLAAIINNTAKPLLAKLCDYTFADKVLETNVQDFVDTKANYNTYVNDAATALGYRQTSQDNINYAQPLVNQRQTELNTLNQQQTTLTQQKSDLDTLKNTRATLQTLYNRVKTILDQLKQHITSHGAITQEIANLVAQAQSLETEIANLEIVIAETEGDIAKLETLVASTSENLTVTNASLTAAEQALLTKLSLIATVIPQDSFSRNGTILTPSSEALRYFSDGFRTGKNTKTLAGLPVKWMIQYYHDGTNDLSTNIYPASASVQYTINGRAYCTNGQKMNNFAHKELVNGYFEEALTKLNTCIALLNQYPNNPSTGIENFLTALKAQIARLQVSQSTDTTIRNHVTATNTFTKKALLQGGSYALFENLVANNPAFSLKIEEITDFMAQKGTIADGTDAMNDLRHMMTTLFAQAFAERLMTTGTDGLVLYTHWEQESLSFIDGLGDTTTLTNQLDMNADWNIDAHGNKYKFGLYHPGGTNSPYTPPATLFMIYSPDGTNTQVIGPVEVKSGTEADAMKARWKEELLKMKRSHVENYSGGDYDIFRGMDETGEYVYWGKYVFGGQLYQTGFQKTTEATEGYMQNSLKNQMNIFNQNRANYAILLNAWQTYLQKDPQNITIEERAMLYVYCLDMIELYKRPDFRMALFAVFPEFQTGGIQHIYDLKNDLDGYLEEIDQQFAQLNVQLDKIFSPEARGTSMAIGDFLEGYEALADIQTYKDLIAFVNDAYQAIKSGEIITDIIDTSHALYGIVRDFDKIVYSWSDDDIAYGKAYLATTIFLEYNPSGRASKVLSKGVKRVSPKNTYIEMLSKAHLDLLARIAHKAANPIRTLDHLGEVTQVAQLKKKIRVTNPTQRAKLEAIRNLSDPHARGTAGEEFIRELTNGDKIKFPTNTNIREIDAVYQDPVHGQILAEVKTYEGNLSINDFLRSELRRDRHLESGGKGRPVVYILGAGQDATSGFVDEATKNGIEVIILSLD